MEHACRERVLRLVGELILKLLTGENLLPFRWAPVLTAYTIS